ncbi:MAG TPA: carbohydrate binding domain-containing protein [Polyangiaceae bacterium]|jgi:hypothetical protein|nr:carbohydrate binding domain-containing protein [Polyangiaceae bacterium]
MNSSFGFRFWRVASSAMLLGLVAGACLSPSNAKNFTSTCTTNADCATGSQCNGGTCTPLSTPSGGSTATGGSGGGASVVGGSSSGGAPVVATAGSSAGGMTQTGPTSDLVDDLEDNDARIIVTNGRQGSWYAFSDGTITPSPPDDNGNTNGFLPGSPGAGGSMHAAHVQANGFPNYAGLAVDFNNAGVRPKDIANRKVYDVSAYDGIVFNAKGTASGQMRVMAVTKQIAGTTEGGTCDDSNSANHCWDSYGSNFSLGSDWTEVRVRFSDMSTDNASPFDLTSVFGLAFQVNAQNGSLDFWVDDLALFKDGTSSGTGGTSSGGMSAGGSSAAGSSSGPSSSTPLPAISGGSTGFATRYWDCCKPACAWPGTQSMASCDSSGNTSQGKGNNNQSACSGGDSYMCYNYEPWVDSSNGDIAYGFAAASGSNYVCGRCFEVQFNGTGNSGGTNQLTQKTMYLQVINDGGVQANQFDILIPGGGVGAMNACTQQWGQNADLGSQFGGLFAECNDDVACTQNKCNSVFAGKPDLLAGCNWFLTWYTAADNPNIVYQQVSCPSQLSAKSGMSG